MQDFEVSRYYPSNKNEWNTFVKDSNQQTFLFLRDFMDYHSHRFQDFSLMIYKGNTLVALLPANKVDNKVYSHQGLTYGGLILSGIYQEEEIRSIFEALILFFKKNEITEVNIKGLPEFYSNVTAVIKNIAKNSFGAKTYKTEKVLAIDYKQPFTIHKTKLKNYRKNKEKGFAVKESASFGSFWNDVLIPRLHIKHNAKPVHSLKEIELLKSRFPDNIKQFNIYLKDEILAGITIFDKGKVIKSQYGATTKLGEKERALEYLFLYLIYKFKSEGKSFFSMGTVTENNEIGYNKGLLKQKQELGCLIYKQDFYSLPI